VSGEGLVTVFPPVGLYEDAVDLFKIDDACLIAHGFDEGTDSQVAQTAEDALGGADYQGQGFLGEGVVTEAGAIELGQEKGLQSIRGQARQDDRIGDAGADLLVDGQGQRLQGTACLTDLILAWMELPWAMSMAPRTRIFK